MLVLILRAITTQDDLKASEDCITVARNTLDLHEQCMELVRGCQDPELVTKYTTWYVSRTREISLPYRNVLSSMPLPARTFILICVDSCIV